MSVLSAEGTSVAHTEMGFVFGTAWSPDGREVWFTGSETGSAHDRALYALSLDGRRRLVFRAPGSIWVSDVSRDKRSALIVTGAGWFGINAAINGSTEERSLDHLGRTDIVGLTADSKRVLMYERREVGTGSYLRTTDGAMPILLTTDIARALSPDGAWALVQTQARDREPTRLRLMPTGAGAARDVPLNPGLVPVDDYGQWSRDGRVFLLMRAGENTPSRVYVHDLKSGTAWRPVTPERSGAGQGFVVSPDGGTVAAPDASGVVTLYGVDGQPPRVLEGERGVPVHWMADGALLLKGPERFHLRIYRRDLSTGRVETWRTLAPADRTGVQFVGRVLVAADDRSYVYQYSRTSNDLYLASNLR